MVRLSDWVGKWKSVPFAPTCKDVSESGAVAKTCAMLEILRPAVTGSVNEVSAPHTPPLSSLTVPAGSPVALR